METRAGAWAGTVVVVVTGGAAAAAAGIWGTDDPRRVGLAGAGAGRGGAAWATADTISRGSRFSLDGHK